MAGGPGGQPQGAAGGQVPKSGASLPVDPDEAFQAELFNTFIGLAPEYLTNIRQSLLEFWRVVSEADPLSQLLELYCRVRALAGSAGIAGLHHLSETTTALEVLLKDLYDKPKRINGSTVRTVADAIDVIGELSQTELDPDWHPPSAIRILVVDDDALYRRAILHSLELVALKAVSLQDPRQALELVKEVVYDLILLDDQMPEMGGSELCKRIHAEPKNRTTPVIFVSAMTDFTSRARLTLSGGADLVGKPFLFSELGVKALTYVWRGQVAKRCTMPGLRAPSAVGAF